MDYRIEYIKVRIHAPVGSKILFNLYDDNGTVCVDWYADLKGFGTEKGKGKCNLSTTKIYWLQTKCVPLPCLPS